MGYDHHRARYESCLARAHRALFDARAAADEGGDQGAVHDLIQIEKEVTRLAEASLRGKARRTNRLDGLRT